MENNVASPWPWLVFLGGEKHESQVFCDLVSDPKTTGITRSIPDLNINFMVPTNIDGWLLLDQGNTSMCLWNAVTLQSIDLPNESEVLDDYEWDCVFLTKSPNDCDCVILLLNDDSPSILHYHVHGDDRWTLRNYEEELMKFRDGKEYSEDRFYSPFSYDDDNIFMISYSNVVAKIETVKPNMLAIRHDLSFLNFRIPASHVVGPSRTLEYLVACYSEVFMIHVSSGGANDDQISSPIVGINVFKLDFSNKSWKIVDGCPNTSFFISDKQCLAFPIASTDSSKVGNHVYIVECDYYDADDEENFPLLYTYHIQQKTLKKSLIATPKDKKSNPYWMLVPDAQALAKIEEDYNNRRDREKHQSFVECKKTDVMMVQTDYEVGKKNFSLMLDDLHDDILKKILSHLTSPLDYLYFRSINRRCRELGCANEWKNITSCSYNFSNSSSPWLIFPNSQQVGKGLFHMVNPISRNTYYTRIPKTWEENSRICYSSYGWLLISSPCLEDGIIIDLNLVLYNPMTKTELRLPEIPEHVKHFYFHCSPNDDQNFLAISIDDPEPRFYKLSDKEESNTDEDDQKWEWVIYEMTKTYEDDKLCVRQFNVNIIFVENVFYFLVGDGSIAYFLEDEFIVRIHNLEEPCRKSSYERYFLASCDEDLLSIYIGKEWKWLRAFKFNESDKAWDEVEELKNNNCLYLSYISSTTSKPQSPEIGNRIYFSIFYQGSIIYYSFNTRKFHLSDGKDSVMNDYHALEEQMYSCWFEPTWVLVE